MQAENPKIDWDLRTVKIGSLVSTDKGGKMEQPTLQNENLRTWRRQGKEQTKGGEDLSEERRKYQQEIKEIQGVLPEEIKDFADIFCQNE